MMGGRLTTGHALTSLVLPLYNPGVELDQTLAALPAFVARQAGPWEVLFVCDGCTDGSAERLTEWVAARPGPYRAINYRPNRGKGYALRRGLAAARGAWRIFTDIDLAYSLEEVERIAATLRGGAEMAIASRTHPDSRIVLPPSLQGYLFRRHLQSQVFSALVRLLLPLPQRDTQAGLKGMSAQLAERLLPRVRCKGFGFDCELLTACARWGVPVVEVPVRVSYHRTVSTTNGRATLRMLRELWKIRRRWPASKSAPEPAFAPRPIPAPILPARRVG